MMFSNFNKKAAWKSKLYSKEEWLKSLSFKHPLFDLPFLSGENVEPDELHIFHLGMLQYFYGSTLWLLTYSILKGTPEENAEFIWRKIIEHYEANPTSTQIGNLQLSMFVGDVKQPTVLSSFKSERVRVQAFVAGPLIHLGHNDQEE